MLSKEKEMDVKKIYEAPQASITYFAETVLLDDSSIDTPLETWVTD